MKATLVYKTENQRFYELSCYINKGKSDIVGEVCISEKMSGEVERLKVEYKEIIPYMTDPKGIQLVCVSDALTHVERLVFPAVLFGGKFAPIGTDIGGKHTMMIHGGDPESIYDDEVYLRRLAQLNGLEWEGFLKEED